jgi:hypothetical protein
MLSQEAGCAVVGAHHVESLVMTLAGQVLDEVHAACRYGSIDPGGVVGVKACQSFLYWCRRHQHLPLRPKNLRSVYGAVDVRPPGHCR